MTPQEEIALQFCHGTTVKTVLPYGAGNVNDTYLVQSSAGTRFILQRINQQVFQKPVRIAQNLRIFTEHVQRKVAAEKNRAPAENSPRRWETPSVIGTRDGDDYLIDQAGDFWRAITFIEGTRTFGKILNAEHASEAGFALAKFHSLTHDLDSNTLHDTLEGFHVTPQYLRNYDTILANTAVDLNNKYVQEGMAFIEERRGFASVLEDAKESGQLSLCTMHGDPKVDNILIDEQSNQAVGIIDLDTVKPGLVHYDIGDCLRSCCNPLGEETDKFDAIRFDTDLCRVILRGYLPVAREFFQPNDYDYLFDSIRLIAFELGLRFFTDHLAGNVYFKANHPTHNLQRGIAQFRLAEEIEACEGDIRTIIAELR